MQDILGGLGAGSAPLPDPDPVRRAQLLMRTPRPKRTYRLVTIAERDGGFGIMLDARPARTPARSPIILPTRVAAEMVAAEYDAQIDTVNPVTMPVTRLINTAIDGVARESEAVLLDIVRFASSDLLCYRADGPERLAARQNAVWNPILDWVQSSLGARFVLAEGVVFVEQPVASIAAIKRHLEALSDPLLLASLHLMTSLSGSALLALAVESCAIDAEDAWRACHIDEDWQIEHWGQDAEAMARRNARHRDFMAAADLIAAIRQH